WHDTDLPRAFRAAAPRGAATRRRAGDCVARETARGRARTRRSRRRKRIMSETMRIQRALARAGVASRRKAEELIAAGRVQVNGDLAHTGQVVDASADAITVDGTPVAAPRAAEWL